MRVAGDLDGRGLSIEAAAYRLEVVLDRPWARLTDERGEPWADACLLGSIDTVEGPDETVGFHGPDVSATETAVSLTWRVESSRWAAKRVIAEATDDELVLGVEVEGDGRIADVSFFGGRSVLPGTATGWLASRPWFRSVFSAAPSDPARIILPASESAENSASGGSEPGRGPWFFTPGPLCYAVSRVAASEPGDVPEGRWLAFGLDAGPDELGHLGFGYRALGGGFHFQLDYEGHTAVTAAWRSPRLVILPAPDPFAAIDGYRRRLGTTHLAAEVGGGATRQPRWWREPIFCGWGAQCALAREQGLPFSAGARFATQHDYDEFLAHLARHGVVPGTIAIDDKWAVAYGTCEPDEDKWPDLRGWIADRKTRGQRVVLWWKAWDPEGLDPDVCVRTPAGAPVVVDPEHPGGDRAIRTAVRRMLAPEGLDADGLKIDFTGRTPSGSNLVHHGDRWGIELLRRLLAIVHDEAKRLKPDCLLIGQVPEPRLAAFVDMIRLNDMLRLDDPEPRVPIVPQMRYRAGIVGAACPDHLLDTDDWCAPDLSNWRAYTVVKPSLGVPALYYATGLDLSREAFEADDYALLRRTWSEYRERAGLPPRRRPPAAHARDADM